MVGATPVFVDIDPKTFNIDPHLIESAITERTRAILPVHLYGQAADMDLILSLARRYGLKVIEDTAQAFGGEYKGRKLGTLGDAGAFSFYPSKNLGAFGDGGLVVTNDDEVAQKARMLRTHGSRKKHYNEMWGYNSRLDEVQAAVLRVGLRYVDEWNARRREAAGRYKELLVGTPGVVVPAEAPHRQHVYHLYTVRLREGQRERVRRSLNERGIQAAVYYPVCLHKLSVYASYSVTLQQAEAASRTVLSLPIGPSMTSEEQELVAEALHEAVIETGVGR
jgi:dTDP-4-amino-4,6-dideoxygalactose transaminase